MLDSNQMELRKLMSKSIHNLKFNLAFTISHVEKKYKNISMLEIEL